MTVPLLSVMGGLRGRGGVSCFPAPTLSPLSALKSRCVCFHLCPGEPERGPSGLGASASALRGGPGCCTRRPGGPEPLERPAGAAPRLEGRHRHLPRPHAPGGRGPQRPSQRREVTGAALPPSLPPSSDSLSPFPLPPPPPASNFSLSSVPPPPPPPVRPLPPQRQHDSCSLCR